MSVRLEEKHKEFVVKGFAKYQSLGDICAEFLLEFDIEVFELCDRKYYTEEEFIERFSIEYSRERMLLDKDELIHKAKNEYIKMMQDETRKVTTKLATRFRRLNINHPQFPEKYRELFEQTRQNYVDSFKSKGQPNTQNLLNELDTLYGYSKQIAFETQDVRQLNLVHQIIKTIISIKDIEDNQNTMDAISVKMKSLENSESSSDQPIQIEKSEQSE